MPRPEGDVAMAILDADQRRDPNAPSFTLGNRVYRAAWSVCWLLLAAWTPPALNAWRLLLLRAFGAKLAAGATVYASARIWSPANLALGEYACIGPRVNVYAMAPITLGAHALVSQGAHLVTGTHDIADPRFQLHAKPISIGARAWIAAEAFIGPGVTVGEGAVLGARGCAFGDLAAWTVYAGNPAKPIKPRRLRR